MTFVNQQDAVLFLLSALDEEQCPRSQADILFRDQPERAAIPDAQGLAVGISAAIADQASITIPRIMLIPAAQLDG